MSDFEQQVLDELSSIKDRLRSIENIEKRAVLDSAIEAGLSSGNFKKYVPGQFTAVWGERHGDHA